MSCSPITATKTRVPCLRHVGIPCDNCYKDVLLPELGLGIQCPRTILLASGMLLVSAPQASVEYDSLRDLVLVLGRRLLLLLSERSLIVRSFADVDGDDSALIGSAAVVESVTGALVADCCGASSTTAAVGDDSAGFLSAAFSFSRRSRWSFLSLLAKSVRSKKFWLLGALGSMPSAF